MIDEQMTAAELYNILRGELAEKSTARRIVDAAIDVGAVTDDHTDVVWHNHNSVRDHLRDEHGIPDAWIPTDLDDARGRHDAHHGEGFEHLHGIARGPHLVVCVTPTADESRQTVQHMVPAALQGLEKTVVNWWHDYRGRDMGDVHVDAWVRQ